MPVIDRFDYVAAFLILSATCSSLSAGAEGTVAIEEPGEAHVALRYRYEHVDQDNLLQDANASTVRIRLNYKTSA